MNERRRTSTAAVVVGKRKEKTGMFFKTTRYYLVLFTEDIKPPLIELEVTPEVYKFREMEDVIKLHVFRLPNGDYTKSKCYADFAWGEKRAKK